MRVYQNIKVWQKSHNLTLAIYAATSGFPADERFGLVSQLRRSASSIPANMAEGSGRNGSAELARFMDVSMGSANELEYHLLLARDLGYLDQEEWSELSERTIEVKRMLASFLKAYEPRSCDPTTRRITSPPEKPARCPLSAATFHQTSRSALPSAAWAAASRAVGMRIGEQLT